jgi:hypothetical protein
MNMDTHTKMEAELEVELRYWAKALDEMEAEEAAEEKEFRAEMAAAKAEVKAYVQKTVTDTRTKHEAEFDKLSKTIDTLSEKINVALDHLDADIAKAQGKAKADLETRRATLKSNRTKLQVRMQENLETWLNHIVIRINEIEARADFVNASVREKVKGQVAVLLHQGEVAEQAVQTLKASQQTTWKENKVKADRALAALREGYNKAVAELKTTQSK